MGSAKTSASPEPAYRTIQVTPNADGFGAEITGLDLSRPLSPYVLADVKRAWAEHSVVWFPDQPLELDELEAFTLQFGEFGVDPFIKPMPGHPNILELRREANETAKNFGAGWHSDWSFQERPPAATILHAKIVPPVGGDTLFACGYRAYGALPGALKALLAPLTALHSASRPYGRSGAYASESEKRAMQIVTGEAAEALQGHPVIRRHPVTGRASLFVNPIYTVGLLDKADEEAKSILDRVFAHMLDRQFIYRHRWRPNMLTLWDNRCTMHYADGGYDGHLRVMHRTTVAGEAPIRV